MDKNVKNRWIVISIVAAVVAVVTTLVVLTLRARAKKKAWYEQEAFDYDVDDCECFDDLDAEFVEPASEEAEV